MGTGEDTGEREERPKTRALREIATLSINDKEEDAKFATMIMFTFRLVLMIKRKMLNLLL
jgi:hypothetical protein